MSDDERAFFEGFILAARSPNRRKPTNHRLVLEGVFWSARTGSPGRDLRKEFGKWSSVYPQLRRCTLARMWEHIPEALNESRIVPDALQMSCCRFRGHEDKIVTKETEIGHGETEVHEGVQV